MAGPDVAGHLGVTGQAGADGTNLRESALARCVAVR